jgi:multicomponent Na+:H+ antiporter subunit G
MSIFEIVAIFFICSGVFFLLVGSIGLIRLPDFYSRSHATGKADTLGILLIIVGLVFYEGFTLNSAKLLIIFTFVALTNPTATHALARAAYLFGVKPRFKKDLEEEKKGN